MKIQIAQRRNQRDSNIELLRIIAACFVVVLHYLFPKVYDSILELPLGVDRAIRLATVGFLESMSTCAVNVFVLITGFFLCTSIKRSWDKPVKLVLFLIIVRAVVFVLNSIHVSASFSVREWLLYSLPRNYFVPLYIALYLISPYINIVVNRLSRREWRLMIIMLLSVFSFWNIAVDLVTEISGKDLNSMTTFARLGSSYGQTLVNFCLLYCIGAFLRLNNISMKKGKSIGLFFASTLVLLFWFLLETKTQTRITEFTFCYYHNPLVIAQAVLLFLFFKELRIRSSLINELATAAFACYILQGYMLNFIGVEKAAVSSLPALALHLSCSVILIYLSSYVVYKCYTLVTSRLFQKLRIDIPLFEDRQIQ